MAQLGIIINVRKEKQEISVIIEEVGSDESFTLKLPSHFEDSLPLGALIAYSSQGLCVFNKSSLIALRFIKKDE